MRPRDGSPHGRLVAAALGAALLAAPGAPAAPPTPPTPSASSAKPAPAPTADEIVERYVTARGGIEKLRALQSLRQEGRVNAGAGRYGPRPARVQAPREDSIRVHRPGRHERLRFRRPAWMEGEPARRRDGCPALAGGGPGRFARAGRHRRSPRRLEEQGESGRARRPRSRRRARRLEAEAHAQELAGCSPRTST